MYPPEDEPHFDPNRTTLHWMVEEYPKLEHWQLPLECTIKQGEVIIWNEISRRVEISFHQLLFHRYFTVNFTAF